MSNSCAYSRDAMYCQESLKLLLSKINKTGKSPSAAKEMAQTRPKRNRRRKRNYLEKWKSATTARLTSQCKSLELEIQKSYV